MDEIIEIFGKRLKVVQDNFDSSDYCEICAIKDACWRRGSSIPFCKDAKGYLNRHFEEVIN